MSNSDLPARPVPGSSNYTGATKREEFAKSMMVAGMSTGNHGNSLQELARLSVKGADALLKELEK